MPVFPLYLSHLSPQFHSVIQSISKFGHLYLQAPPSLSPKPSHHSGREHHLAYLFSLFLPWHPTVLSHEAKEMGSYQYRAYSPSVLPNNAPEKIPALSHLLSSECPSQALFLHQLLCALFVPWQPQACAPPGTVHFFVPFGQNTLSPDISTADSWPICFTVISSERPSLNTPARVAPLPSLSNPPLVAITASLLTFS